jgi:uncharacterized delta-60 repeat protein
MLNGAGIQRSILGLIVLGMFLCQSQAAGAKAGDLDRAFGQRGKAITRVDTGPGWFGVAVQIAAGPDGELLVLRGTTFLRYLPGGRLDRSFGSGGRSKVEVPGFDLSVSDFDVDSRGRAVVFGTATDLSRLLSPYTSSYPAGALFLSFATVIRYTAAGNLDPTFGGGDGIVTTNFGLPAFPGTAEPSVTAGAGIVDSEDRPVLIGGKGEIASPCAGHSYYDDFDKLLARLTSAGELDVSFGGGDGIAFLEGIDEVSDMAIGEGGALTVAAHPDEPCGLDFALLRMHRNGGPDHTFGGDGAHRYRLGSPERVVLDRFGRIYVQTEGIVRLKADGDVDRTFGRRGVATVHLPGGQSGAGLAAVDPAGRPLLVGTLTFRAKQRGPTRERLRRRFVVIRLNATGRPDRGFGHRGWTMTSFGRFSSASARDALIDRNGRLVVAGAVNRPDLDPTGGVALARYLLGP